MRGSSRPNSSRCTWQAKSQQLRDCQAQGSPTSGAKNSERITPFPAQMRRLNADAPYAKRREIETTSMTGPAAMQGTIITAS